MNFRLNNWKINICFIVIFLWYIVLLALAIQGCADLIFSCQGVDCGFCEDMKFSLIPDCQGCSSVGDVVLDVVIILVPGFLVYLVWSLFEKKRVRKKDKVVEEEK